MKSFTTDGDFAQNYKFLIGSILPRPIAVVSTLNENGTNNLAPFSFFTAVSAKPMIIAFSPMIRTSTGLLKDTPKNILRQKEFVISFVSEEIVDRINLCAQELPYGEDEFLASGLTPIPSDLIKPMRMKESKIHFECIYRDSLSYGDNVGAGMIITGEVVKVHIQDDLLDSGRISTDAFNPIGRGAGNDWIKCDHRFEKERLTLAQIQK